MAANQYSKLVIFDLDGVLIDSREMHFEALNRAISTIAGDEFVISKEEHLSTYDGLPTRKKLELLTQAKNLPEYFHRGIAGVKQIYTREKLLSLTSNEKLQDICEYLEDHDFKIAVATNAVYETADIAIDRLGLWGLVSCVMSAENVEKGKPHPQMYWKAMEKCNAIPATTIIIEDSHIGRQGALDSGATLLAVEDPDDLTKDKVVAAVERFEQSSRAPNIPWRNSGLNVLIPMAGAGSRFTNAGYTFPKPLIEVHGKPMIQVVVENLNIEANYIYIVQAEHYEKYNLKYLLNLITPGCTIIQTEGLTEGAACTTLLARDHINNDAPLLIANSDQFVEWNSNEVLYAFSGDQINGGIVTFKNTHPKWSFAKVGEDGFVCEVAEKKPISDNATVGIYYWKHGNDYVWSVDQMIEKNIRTNGEFYVAPAFNEAIQAGMKIRMKQIDRMWGLGTPEDLEVFLNEK
tara:strand:- start:29502 stop:30887 length:1386 start_codon:yes stop_codon:yes gene_type:complete